MSFTDLKLMKTPEIVYLRHRDQDHFSVTRGINEGSVANSLPGRMYPVVTTYQLKI